MPAAAESLGDAPTRNVSHAASINRCIEEQYPRLRRRISVLETPGLGLPGMRSTLYLQSRLRVKRTTPGYNHCGPCYCALRRATGMRAIGGGQHLASLYSCIDRGSAGWSPVMSIYKDPQCMGSEDWRFWCTCQVQTTPIKIPISRGANELRTGDKERSSPRGAAGRAMAEWAIAAGQRSILTLN